MNGRRRGATFSRVLVSVLAGLIVELAAAPAASAQNNFDVRQQDTAATDQVATNSQPLRAARLSFLQGSVTVTTNGSEGNQTAQLNLPVLAGGQISTGADGQAEVEFEDGSFLRLTPNTKVSLDQMPVAEGGLFSTSISLVRGLVYAELRAAPEYQYTLRAGQDVLTPVENVTVRVSFDQPPAAFAVISGRADVADADGENGREVKAGETLTEDTEAAGQYLVSYAIAGDSWDTWNSDLDQAEASEAVDRTDVRNDYAGAQGYGWSDLDADGTWYDVPGEGQVWQPVVAAETAGWDPYGFGSWVWYPATGYVWSSSYTWGWTPYRCGTWSFYGSFGWGWSPAGCGGGLGWTFWGAGRPVNVIAGPGGYRVPHVPRRPPGPVHPIVPGREEPPREPGLALVGGTGWGTRFERTPRQINGSIAIPVPRGSEAVLNGTPPVRSGLDRDFPVDRNSHIALTGRAASQPGFVPTGSGWRRDTGDEPYTGQSGAAIFRDRHAVARPDPSTANTAPRSTFMPPGSGPQQRQAYVRGEVARPDYRGLRPADRSEHQSSRGPGYERNQNGPPAFMPRPVTPTYMPPPSAPRYSPPASQSRSPSPAGARSAPASSGRGR